MMTRAGVLHDEGGVVGRALLHGPRFRRALGTAGLAAEAAQDHRDEAAVHALAHDVGEDRARRAHQRAGDDQRGVLQREADARRRPAGIGIQHRDHHRHVGAADGNDQGDAEDEARAGDRPERPVRLVHDEIDDQADDRGEDQKVEHMPRRQNDRRARHVAVELGEGDERAGEGDGADGDAQATSRSGSAHADSAVAADAVGVAAIERRAATSTAARPTSEWNAATSCGMAVMAMRRAITAPMPPPMARPPTIMPQVSGIADARHPQRGQRWRSPCRSCRCGCPRARWRATTAPQRQDEQHAGDEIERARRYRLVHARCSLLLFLLVHREHALGDQEAAEDVHARPGSARQKPRTLEVQEALSERRHRHGDQRADHDHRGNRVGHAHQRRVQRRASRSTPRNSRRKSPARKSKGGRQKDRSASMASSPSTPDGRSRRPRVRPAPLMISSSQSSASAPVFLSTIRQTKLNRLRA